MSDASDTEESGADDCARVLMSPTEARAARATLLQRARRHAATTMQRLRKQFEAVDENCLSAGAADTASSMGQRGGVLARISALDKSQAEQQLAVLNSFKRLSGHKRKRSAADDDDDDSYISSEPKRQRVDAELTATAAAHWEAQVRQHPMLGALDVFFKMASECFLTGVSNKAQATRGVIAAAAASSMPNITMPAPVPVSFKHIGSGTSHVKAVRPLPILTKTTTTTTTTTATAEPMSIERLQPISSSGSKSATRDDSGITAAVAAAGSSSGASRPSSPVVVVVSSSSSSSPPLLKKDAAMTTVSYAELDI
jgi:hypothetical protein